MSANKKNTQGAKSASLKDVKQRNEYYQDGKPQALGIMIIGVVCAAVGVGTLMYSASQKENNVYIATNESGSILNLVALSMPNQKNSVVSNWVGEALIDTFDFSYYNLNDRLNKSTMKWFTKEGGQKLLSTLQDTGNLDVIRDKELFVSLALKHTPLIVKEAKPDWSNAYMWKIEVEAIMTYRTKASVYTNDVVFAVLVTRRSNLEDAMGLGISSIIMTKK
jgi:intracellular multiplication protein IcmL